MNSLISFSRMVPTLLGKVLLIGVLLVGCQQGGAAQPAVGQRYEIIKPLYIMGVYNSLNKRVVSKETARAYLQSTEFAKKSFVAFQSHVPIGTVMTVTGLIPNPWYRFYSSERFLVKLEPDLSKGLEVELELARGLEGSLDGLSSEFFRIHQFPGIDCGNNKFVAAEGRLAGVIKVLKSSSKPWDELNKVFLDWVKCKDRFQDELFINAIAELTHSRFASIVELAEIKKKNPGFYEYVIRSLGNDTVGLERSKEIHSRSLKSCPDGLSSICKDIESASKNRR